MGAWYAMVEVRKLAGDILDFLREESDRRGRRDIPIATLYKTFERQATYAVVQQAVKFLVDRDLIAPYSYGLTAKGRRERLLETKERV
jgi:hypothetical protein